MAKENEMIEEPMPEDTGEEMPEEEMGTEETAEPMATEITIPVADFPGIEAVAVGDTLSVMSNDGTNIVLSFGAAEEAPAGTEPTGEGASAISGEF